MWAQEILEIAGPHGSSFLSHSAVPSTYAGTSVLAESLHPTPFLANDTLKPQGDPMLHQGSGILEDLQIVRVGSAFGAGL